MTIEAYINPDFGWKEKLIFFLEALAGIIICVSIILLYVRLSLTGASKRERAALIYDKSVNRVQRFYEMIMAGTSVMSFSCAYVIISHIYGLMQSGQGEPGPLLRVLMNAWAGGRDFVLLLLICLSCVINSILDMIIIPVKALSKEEKATIRMLGMFYVIIILLILNRVGDESEYNPVMMYYLGLMVGRFVYFDASFGDFVDALKNVIKDIYQLLLGLILTGVLTGIGFSAGYLLERNYYIVGVFYTNLFMLSAVFVLHHSHLLNLIIKKPREDAKETAADTQKYPVRDRYEDEYEEDAYDDADYYEDEEYYGNEGYYDDPGNEQGYYDGQGYYDDCQKPW